MSISENSRTLSTIKSEASEDGSSSNLGEKDTVTKIENIKIGNNILRVRRQFMLYGSYRVGWVYGFELLGCEYN
jgi:hypothetical protein